jgi:hypothetical protein
VGRRAEDSEDAVKVDSAEQGEVEVEEEFVQVAIGQGEERCEDRDGVDRIRQPVLSEQPDAGLGGAVEEVLILIGSVER